MNHILPFSAIILTAALAMCTSPADDTTPPNEPARLIREENNISLLYNGAAILTLYIDLPHDYCFDVASGRLVWPDDEPYRLRRYDVKEEGGVVKVRTAR